MTDEEVASYCDKHPKFCAEEGDVLMWNAGDYWLAAVIIGWDNETTPSSYTVGWGDFVFQVPNIRGRVFGTFMKSLDPTASKLFLQRFPTPEAIIESFRPYLRK